MSVKQNRSTLSFYMPLAFLVVWLLLWRLNLEWSRDLSVYKNPYLLAETQPFFDRFLSLSIYHDPGYYVLQNLFASFLPFDYFLGAVIFLCLFFKFYALTRINPKPGFLDVLPYLSILAFLHEGTQIRITLALTFILWAIIFFIKGLGWRSVLLILIGSAFHLSAALYFLIFGIIFFRKKYGSKIFIAIFILAMIIVFFPFAIDSLLQFGGPVAKERYFLYLGDAFRTTQNTSGLFNFFVFFVAFLVGLFWGLFRPQNSDWENFREFSLVCGLTAITILLSLKFSVVIASRLADLLLMPIVIVLGATLTQLSRQSRYLLLSTIIILFFIYGFLRAYISFGQNLVKPLL